MADKKKLALSRRQLLGGLGSVGVASAGAGLGTTALFNDEESFEDNSITAGTLDLLVDAKVPQHGINDDWHGAIEFSGYDPATADGGPGTGISLGDMKPGDWVILCYDLTVQTNPACLSLTTENTADDENSVTEPEADAEAALSGSLDDPNTSETNSVPDPDGKGELAGSLDATIYDDLDESALDGSLAGAESALSNELLGDETLAGVWDTFDGGAAIAADTTSFDFYLLLELPSDTGNVVQSDSVEWDFVFDAIQSRNNECDTPVWEDGGDTPTVTLPADKNYIGYEDRTGGDFDYNDFGMDANITETYSDGTLDSVEMEFTSLEHTAADSLEIHLERTFDSSVSWELTVGRDHTHQGTEKPVGTTTGSGTLDVVLFDTDFFAGGGDTVTLDVTITSGSVSEPTSSPRPDVAADNPLFEVYDPYMYNRSTTKRIDMGTIQDNRNEFDTESDVPNIIVVPDPDFNPPGATVTIDDDYPEFDEYYGNGSGDTDGDLDVDPTYDEWYNP